jgi:hypothetical protein
MASGTSMQTDLALQKTRKAAAEFLQKQAMVRYSVAKEAVKLASRLAEIAYKI